ncbi:MAG: regulatory protein RecX [Ruminococcus sp.]|jgi:regulatory protein|nr:regulatory protein RecX [Ruminococcus sp.]
MIVTKVESVTKAKFKVYLDGQFAFVLYKGELSRFGISEEEELSEEVYAQIRKDVVLKRAKLRAMHLLTDMDRTEAGLREKLLQGMYPEDLVEEALSYVRSFGYLNDLRYAENFIESKKDSKSRKEIYALLSRKGVPAEQIEQAFDTCYSDHGEQEAIRCIIRKKRMDISSASREEIQKFCGYLARKGFRYEEILRAVQQ